MLCMDDWDPVKVESEEKCICGTNYAGCWADLRVDACLGPDRLRFAPRAGMTMWKGLRVPPWS
jgi:hypothetical protein